MSDKKEPVTGRSGGKASQKKNSMKALKPQAGSQMGQHQTRWKVEARPFNQGLIG